MRRRNRPTGVVNLPGTDLAGFSTDTLIRQPPAIPPSLPGTPSLPIAPQTYTIPGGAYLPTSVSDFQARVAAGGAADIIIPDVVQTKATGGPLTAGARHRLWQQTLLGGTLQYGLFSNFGLELHGARVKLIDATHVNSTNPAAVFSNGGLLTIQDCEIDGGRQGFDSSSDFANSGCGSPLGTPIWGVWCIQAGGAIIERSIVKNATSDGIYLPTNGGNVDRIWDCLITDCRRPTQGNSYGTSEAGLRLYHPQSVTNGVRRLEIRRCGYGIVTVNGGGNTTTFSDIRIDEIRGDGIYSGGGLNACNGGTGFYFERTTTAAILENFYIGPNVRYGTFAEWDVNVAGTSGAVNCIIRNGTIDNSVHLTTIVPNNLLGTFFDQGCNGNTIQNVKFVRQTWGCIGFKSAGNSTSGNDYSLSTMDAAHQVRTGVSYLSP